MFFFNSQAKTMNEMDKYIAKANNKEERKLTKQKNEGIKEIWRVHKLLKKKKLTFKKEIEFMEKRMIPYVTRQKWMPWSYRHFLEAWEGRYLELGGKS